MVQLVKYFNDNYGLEYGNIDYPRTTIQIYKVYQAIKSYGINDNKLIELLHNIKLPNPKSVEEKELYTDCLYNKDDNEFERDIFDTKEKKCLYKNTLSVKDATCQKGSVMYVFNINTTFEFNENNSYYIILNEKTSSNVTYLDKGALGILEDGVFMVEIDESFLCITLPNEIDIINFSLWENNECIFETQFLSRDSIETEITKDSYTFEINENFNFNNYSSYYFVINNEVHRNKYRIINNRIEFSSEDINVLFSEKSISIEKNNINNYINIELWEDEEKIIKNSCLNKDVVIKRNLSIGLNTFATNDYSFAQGSRVSASGESSHAEGSGSCAKGNYSHAEGSGSRAEGTSSHAEGDCTYSLGDYSHAEGSYTTALGKCSHAEGKSDYKASSSISNLSIDTTNEDIISAWKTRKFSLAKNYSHTEGKNTIALGDYSHAEGYETTALGDYSHAEGVHTTALKNYSHAEGYATNAEGDESHAEGSNNYAIGNASHVEGSGSRAEGVSSHAEGSCTHALGYGSHSEGKNTKASSEAQHVQGKYNIEDSNGKYAHIVGNGTSNSKRSNAHTLDWQGNAWYAGDVYIGGTGQDDTNTKKMATEEFVTTKMSTLPQLSFNDVGELVVIIGGVSKVFVPKTEETGA